MHRYERQRDLVNQERLLKAKVMIAGVGGLGGFTAVNLALAGVGTLILVDPDTVEESNLNRQLLYREDNIGSKKVMVARDFLRELNPHIDVLAIDARVENVDDSIDFDIVVDGLDNYPSRIHAEHLALSRGVPFVFGAVEGYMGMVTFIDSTTRKLEEFIHGENTGTPQVLAATASFISGIQSLEVIKYLSEKGDLLRNRLLIYDALSTNFTEVKL